MPKYTVQFVITSMNVEVTIEVPGDDLDTVHEHAEVSFNHWLNKVSETTQADPMCPDCHATVNIASQEWELTELYREEAIDGDNQ